MDWLAFFEEHGVPYQIGPAQNVRSGFIGINCPRCVSDDKFHFSVDPTSGKILGCWRDPGHWMPPVELVALLARIQERRAKEIIYGRAVEVSGNSPSILLGKMAALGRRQNQSMGAVETMPQDFSRFRDGTGEEHRFRVYFRKRGFEGRVVDALAARHDLRWCFRPKDRKCFTWNGRVIFPVRQGKNLCGWVGRSIFPWEKLRYRAHPSGDAMARLLWEGSVAGAERVVVVEGAVDALKIEAASLLAGRRWAAVALLSNNAGPGKVARLAAVARELPVVVLLDRGAEAQALAVSSSMAILRPLVKFVPKLWKDPGEMPIPRLVDFLSKI